MLNPVLNPMMLSAHLIERNPIQLDSRGRFRASGGRWAGGLIALLGAACGAMALYASELQPLEIAMVESGGNRYFEPAGRRLVIRSQPVRLFVRIRNTSSAEVLIRVRPDLAYAFELTDSVGQMSLVQRKKGAGNEGDADVRVNLSPNAEKIIPIEIRRDTWDGIPDFVAGKESVYTVRVVYETADGHHLYSEPYTLIIKLIQ